MCALARAVSAIVRHMHHAHANCNSTRFQPRMRTACPTSRHSARDSLLVTLHRPLSSLVWHVLQQRQQGNRTQRSCKPSLAHLSPRTPSKTGRSCTHFPRRPVRAEKNASCRPGALHPDRCAPLATHAAAACALAPSRPPKPCHSPVFCGDRAPHLARRGFGHRPQNP